VSNLFAKKPAKKRFGLTALKICQHHYKNIRVLPKRKFKKIAKWQASFYFFAKKLAKNVSV
jgi:hypothetical protein